MAYDAEKQMLRELANFILPQLQCHICHRPMMSFDDAELQGFGHRRHTSVRTLITFHHLDENRENNNIKTNVRIAHPPATNVTIVNGGQNFSQRNQPVQDRKALLANGICVVCQNEPFVDASWPLGKNCRNTFNIADNRAMRGAV